MSDPLDIFTHVPKAAGSTLVKFLAGQYTRARMLDVTPIPPEEQEGRVRALPKETRLIVGHAPYGLHRFTTRSCRYFTVLREPVARVVSSYYYLGRTPGARLHDAIAAGEMNLEKFAWTQVNVQSRYLTGGTAEEWKGREEEQAELACHRLEQDYTAFGLSTQLNLSVLLVARQFGWSVRPFNSHNVAPSGTVRPPTAEEQSVLEETNRVDQQVYAFAERLFAKRVEAAGPGLQRETQAFERRLQRARWWESQKRRWQGLWKRAATE